MAPFTGWNLYVSYTKESDKLARKNAWSFLGRAQLRTGQEVKIYRMFKIKDKQKELERKN